MTSPLDVRMQSDELRQESCCSLSSEAAVSKSVHGMTLFCADTRASPWAVWVFRVWAPKWYNANHNYENPKTFLQTKPGKMHVTEACQYYSTFMNDVTLRQRWALDSNYCPGRGSLKFVITSDAFRTVDCARRGAHENQIRGMPATFQLKVFGLLVRYLNHK